MQPTKRYVYLPVNYPHIPKVSDPTPIQEVQAPMKIGDLLKFVKVGIPGDKVENDHTLLSDQNQSITVNVQNGLDSQGSTSQPTNNHNILDSKDTTSDLIERNDTTVKIEVESPSVPTTKNPQPESIIPMELDKVAKKIESKSVVDEAKKASPQKMDVDIVTPQKLSPISIPKAISPQRERVHSPSRDLLPEIKPNSPNKDELNLVTKPNSPKKVTGVPESSSNHTKGESLTQGFTGTITETRVPVVQEKTNSPKKDLEDQMETGIPVVEKSPKKYVMKEVQPTLDLAAHSNSPKKEVMSEGKSSLKKIDELISKQNSAIHGDGNASPKKVDDLIANQNSANHGNTPKNEVTSEGKASLKKIDELIANHGNTHKKEVTIEGKASPKKIDELITKSPIRDMMGEVKRQPSPGRDVPKDIPAKILSATVGLSPQKDAERERKPSPEKEGSGKSMNTVQDAVVDERMAIDPSSSPGKGQSTNILITQSGTLQNPGMGENRNEEAKTVLQSNASENKKPESVEVKVEKRKAEPEPKELKKHKRDHRFLSPQATKPIIQSVDVVKETMKNYISLRADDAENANETDFETVVFEYPLGVTETFPLVTPKREDYDPIVDLAASARFIASDVVPHLTDLGNEQSGIIRAITKATNRRNIQDLKSAVSDFNKVIQKYGTDGVFDEMETKGDRASCIFIQHILEQSYARSIAPLAHLLNNYEGFSNNVYGEIKPCFVTEIIKHAEIEPTDVFLDLGSGIGNVVLQVAAECLCESYGIEIMENPALFAKKQRTEFVARMHSYAKPCGRIYLKQGDFLKDEGILKVISKADVIFVNNYAFDPALNQGILNLFLDLKEGSRVVSLKPFGSSTGRQQGRRINAIESIFQIKEVLFPRGSVSWMIEGGTYYVHTVDRTQVSGMSII